MKRLALIALLLASSSLVAAPAPVQKPQRKPERPAARQSGAVVPSGIDDLVLGRLNARQAVKVRLLLAVQVQQVLPAQPPNADPPG
jgi:hypothetical protein